MLAISLLTRAAASWLATGICATITALWALETQEPP